LWATLGNEPAEVQAVYSGASTDEHRAALDIVVKALLGKYGLKLRSARVLYHTGSAGWTTECGCTS